MKQEYTDKMKYYQEDFYQSFLKEKCVMDSWQFLHSSFVYLNYALITEKLYQDVGKAAVADSEGIPVSNSVEILGFHYKSYDIMNKFSLEWIAHISNSLDCLAQYINAALNLGIEVSGVCRKTLKNKLETRNLSAIKNVVTNLYDDNNISYIQAAYNYSKHTMDLYGLSSLFDYMKGQLNISIPNFRYRGIDHNSMDIASLMEYYENFIGLYIDVLDAIDAKLKVSSPVNNRFHIGELIVDGRSFGENADATDVTLSVQMTADGKHISRYWIDNPTFAYSMGVQLMPVHNKNYGQHMGFVRKIDMVQNGILVGYLRLKNNKHSKTQNAPDTSTLSYHEYEFVSLT